MTLRAGVPVEAGEEALWPGRKTVETAMRADSSTTYQHGKLHDPDDGRRLGAGARRGDPGAPTRAPPTIVQAVPLTTW